MADNNELTQSLPSCNNTLIQIVEPASEMELVMQDQHQTYAVHQSLLQQHQNYQMVNLISPNLFSLLYFHEFFCTFVSRSVMRPSVVRSRQRCPRLGRKWSRRFLHLWSWCGLQIFKSAWPGPHLQSASGKFWRFFFRSRRARTTDRSRLVWPQ